jgi:hypothetical protein
MREQIFYLRLSDNERSMLKALAERMGLNESQALRTILAAAINELMPDPSKDLRLIFKTVLSQNVVV